MCSASTRLGPRISELEVIFDPSFWCVLNQLARQAIMVLFLPQHHSAAVNKRNYLLYEPYVFILASTDLVIFYLSPLTYNKDIIGEKKKKVMKHLDSSAGFCHALCF